MGGTLGFAQWSRSGGFSLTEMMVVVALMALVLALAAPATAAWALSREVRLASAAWRDSLSLARSEAILRKGRVVLCKSADGQTCQTQGGWQQGWLVFVDNNNNAARDSDEPVLAREGARGRGVRLTANGSLQSYVSYTSLGVAQSVNGAFVAGTMTVCPAQAGRAQALQVVLSNAGRFRVQRADASLCV